MNRVDFNEVVLDVIHTKSEEVGNLRNDSNKFSNDALNCLIQEIVIIQKFQRRANDIVVGNALKELLKQGYKPIAKLLTSKIQGAL